MHVSESKKIMLESEGNKTNEKLNLNERVVFYSVKIGKKKQVTIIRVMFIYINDVFWYCLRG